MNILILGAGQVGGSLAVQLVGEANNITVVDQDRAVLRDLQDRYDLRTVHGHCSHPEVLAQAGAEDADMVIAVSNSDEVNMVACQVAYTLFQTPKKIARVRQSSYLEFSEELFKQEATPIDVLISPEALVTDYVARLIHHPGAQQVLDFANGRIQMVAVEAYYGGSLVGQELKELKEHMPGIKARVAAIFRNDEAILADASTVIEANDLVYYVAAPKHIRAITSELRRVDKPYKRIMIAGGGNIGLRVAQVLENKYQVKILERDPTRCRYLAEKLHNSIVLQADAADEVVLKEENIDNIDVFVALTNDDEANILSAMVARRMGAGKVISLINRPSYVKLVERDIVDIAVSPQQVSIGALLTHVRKGDMVAVHSLRKGAAEAIEVIAHGDEKTTKVIGRRIDEIEWPKGTRAAALARGEEVIMASHNTVIEAEDHLILLVTDKSQIPELEQLFQVDITFL